MTLVPLESLVALALVRFDALALARASTRQVGCDTKAMSDRAIDSQPSIIALAFIGCSARTMSRTNSLIVGLDAIALCCAC